MKINMKNLVPAVVAVIVFLGIIVSVLPYPMAAKRLPLIVSVIAIILLSIVIVQEFLPKKKEPSISQTDEEKIKTKKVGISIKVLFTSVAWIMRLIVLISLFGFVAGSSLYVFIFCKFHGGSWKESILLGLGVAAFIYFVFAAGLKFSLPRGFLFELLLT